MSGAAGGEHLLDSSGLHDVDIEQVPDGVIHGSRLLSFAVAQEVRKSHSPFP